MTKQELSIYDIAQVEDYLIYKLPDILKEYQKKPKPKTKEEKEKEWITNLKPVHCPICKNPYYLGEIKPYICYIKPAKFVVLDYEAKVDYEEFTMIGSNEIHYVSYGINYNIQLELEECINCQMHNIRFDHHYYRPKFQDDESIQKRLQERIKSDIDEIINPSPPDYYYDD